MVIVDIVVDEDQGPLHVLEVVLLRALSHQGQAAELNELKFKKNISFTVQPHAA